MAITMTWGSTTCPSFDSYLTAVTDQVALCGTLNMTPIEYPKQLLLGFRCSEGEWLVRSSCITEAAYQFALKRDPNFQGPFVPKEVSLAFFRLRMAEAVAAGLKRQQETKIEDLYSDAPFEEPPPPTA